VSFGFGSELPACDWVYAADFAARATAAYLGGRVVMVDQHGEGLRVYKVGVLPQRIIDTGGARSSAGRRGGGNETD
jgi:hypothetical protein